MVDARLPNLNPNPNPNPSPSPSPTPTPTQASSTLAASEYHRVEGNEKFGQRKMSMGKNAGNVDSIVFGHDLDMSESFEELEESHHFYGAHGLFAKQLAHKSMANDATSRMHMDNVKSVKDSVFRIEDGQVT